MIHQRVKNIIFNWVRIYSFLTYPLFRIRFYNSKDLYFNIGCGQKKITGFLNIDGNPLVFPNLWYDIRQKLPFNNNVVKVIYISNVLEHFYPDELLLILKEFHRVLQSGGILRLVVPDLKKSIDAYLNKDYHFFPDWPRSFQSIGGKFVNFIFCDAQHKIAFDFDFMKEVLEIAGFNKENIHHQSFSKSLIKQEIYQKIKPYDEEYQLNCLFVEARK